MKLAGNYGTSGKLKYSNLVLRTSKIVDFRNLPEILYRFSRILPYITVRDRGGTAIYTSCGSSSVGYCGFPCSHPSGSQTSATTRALHMAWQFTRQAHEENSAHYILYIIYHISYIIYYILYMIYDIYIYTLFITYI